MLISNKLITENNLKLNDLIEFDNSYSSSYIILRDKNTGKLFSPTTKGQLLSSFDSKFVPQLSNILTLEESDSSKVEYIIDLMYTEFIRCIIIKTQDYINTLNKSTIKYTKLLKYVMSLREIIDKSKINYSKLTYTPFDIDVEPLLFGVKYKSFISTDINDVFNKECLTFIHNYSILWNPKKYHKYNSIDMLDDNILIYSQEFTEYVENNYPDDSKRINLILNHMKEHHCKIHLFAHQPEYNFTITTISDLLCIFLDRGSSRYSYPTLLIDNFDSIKQMNNSDERLIRTLLICIAADLYVDSSKCLSNTNFNYKFNLPESSKIKYSVCKKPSLYKILKELPFIKLDLIKQCKVDNLLKLSLDLHPNMYQGLIYFYLKHDYFLKKFIYDSVQDLYIINHHDSIPINPSLSDTKIKELIKYIYHKYSIEPNTPTYVREYYSKLKSAREQEKQKSLLEKQQRHLNREIEAQQKESQLFLVRNLNYSYIIKGEKALKYYLNIDVTKVRKATEPQFYKLKAFEVSKIDKFDDSFSEFKENIWSKQEYHKDIENLLPKSQIALINKSCPIILNDITNRKIIFLRSIDYAAKTMHISMNDLRDSFRGGKLIIKQEDGTEIIYKTQYSMTSDAPIDFKYDGKLGAYVKTY